MQELTPREYEVAELAAKGYSNKQIGDRLNISEQTVKNHMHSVFRKLALNNRVELTISITRGTRSLRVGRLKVSGVRR
ncbi:MAG: response regulator transcription factor [Terriglobales bacterium]|jgi:two-component system, NarL family, response regulator DegU